jgi:hypothetical protein
LGKSKIPAGKGSITDDLPLVLKDVPQDQMNKVARFLEGQGYKEMALEVATDPAQHHCLVFNHAERKAEGDGIDVLVGKVDTAIPGHVRTGQWVGDCFIYTNSTNRLNYLVGDQTYTISHFDRLNSILVGFTGVQAIDILLARVAKNIEIFFTGKGNEFFDWETGSLVRRIEADPKSVSYLFSLDLWKSC